MKILSKADAGLVEIGLLSVNKKKYIYYKANGAYLVSICAEALSEITEVLEVCFNSKDMLVAALCKVKSLIDGRVDYEEEYFPVGYIASILGVDIGLESPVNPDVFNRCSLDYHKQGDYIAETVSDFMETTKKLRISASNKSGSATVNIGYKKPYSLTNYSIEMVYVKDLSNVEGFLKVIDGVINRNSDIIEPLLNVDNQA